MSISTGIPSNWKLPLFWATVDGSKAGVVNSASRALLVGQMLTAGTATASVPIPVGSVALAQQFFGVGSMLARMVAAFFASNTTQQLWCLPVVEPAAGTAATGSIAIASAPTASGVLTVYIAGQKVQLSVASTDTASAVATALAAAINAATELPVTATAATATVSLTCRWKGDTGNDITIIPNYLGQYGGEAFPTGLTLTITAMANGAGAPVFTSGISAIQMLEYDYLGMPFTDTASMSSWNTEYGFGATGRWNYTRQQYGIIMNARRDTYANLLTWGLSQNSPVMSTMAVEADSPTALWEWTASYCSLAALGFSDDAGAPAADA
jgi:phage tail sheath gpL-like